VAAFFDEARGHASSASAVAKWLINEVPKEAREAASSLPFSGRALGELVELVESGATSGSAGREVLAEMLEQGGEPAAIVERRGLRQLNDESAISGMVAEVIAANAGKAEEYRSGKRGLLGFFIGQVMARTGGRANPGVVRDLVTKALDD
jgi:Asp-tRNA(Asn)/Glu-tRNA(Gln) amidotransferase B subunit